MQESTTAHTNDVQGFLSENWLFELHGKADKDAHTCQVRFDQKFVTVSKETEMLVYISSRDRDEKIQHTTQTPGPESGQWRDPRSQCLIIGII